MNLIFIILACFAPICVLKADLSDHFKPCPNKSDIHTMPNIDFIYMINLDKRPDRFADASRRLNPYGIYPYRFSAVNGWELSIDVINDVGVKYQRWMQSGIMGTYYYLDDQGEIEVAHEIIHVPGKNYFGHCLARGPIGIALSHLSVLQDALDSGYETIWVLEDDPDVIRDPRILPDLIDKLDAIVGKDGWDVLFTDRDIRNKDGAYNPCYWYASRPDFTPRDPDIFGQKHFISPDFQKIGARWGAHSMIVRRSGMKKILSFMKKHKIFLPYDMEYIFPYGVDADIRLFSVYDDVVSNQIDSISDNGKPSYL